MTGARWIDKTGSRKLSARQTLLAAMTLAAGSAFVGGAVADDAKPAAKKAGDWRMWGGAPDRNMVSDEKPPAIEWDAKSGKNIKWRFGLGSQTYGNPVIADGRIYVGTNNNGNLRPKIKGDKGLIVCVDEKTGKFLWQATHDKLPTGQVNDWPEQGICSSPCVVGDKLFYVSNRCELVCADVNGMANGNDGPFTEEKYAEKEDADFVWVLDMIEELGVFPHNLATSSPVVVNDVVYVLTSNGVDEGHLNLPSPVAPAFIAVNAKTGEVVWTRADPGKNTLHGQWSSPSYGVVKGTPQVVFAGGDGWCYGFKPEDGSPLWKFNLNPPDTKYILGGKGTKNYIISTPVIHDDAVFVCVGQDPEHGEGIGHLYRIDATKSGDVTESGKVWHVGGEDFHRSLATAAIKDGLLYDADLSGFVYCMDVKTGKLHWKHDTFAAIWGSATVIGDKVYIGTEDGEVLVFEHSKEKKLIATNDMGGTVYTTPVAANGVLYVTNLNTLFAIQEGASSPPPAKPGA
ncbi:MAG: PQQ-binding-like beta-propeller repeat protein [Phycisphaerae bacterium]|nr:PQQ-binding-like beta-propeller repeat protein [Phycisphaerae bacterium]